MNANPSTRNDALAELDLHLVGPHNCERALDILALAFAFDPLWRWVYPSAGNYLTSFPALVMAMAGQSFEHDSAYCNEDFTAVALCLADGDSPEPRALDACIESTVECERRAPLRALLRERAAARPTCSHWYLPCFGADSLHEGQGTGSTFMRRCLALADANGMPVWFESSNPRNLGFCERQGFRVVGETKRGDMPSVWFLLRIATVGKRYADQAAAATGSSYGEELLKVA